MNKLPIDLPTGYGKLYMGATRKQRKVQRVKLESKFYQQVENEINDEDCENGIITTYVLKALARELGVNITFNPITMRKRGWIVTRVKDGYKCVKK